MRIIYPKAVTLDSSTIAANSDGHAEWSSGTTYGSGDHVMVTTSEPHKIYESLQAGNTNKPPAANPTWWQDQGGTNRWKMFDEFLDTQSEKLTSIVVEVDASNCDRVMLFNMDATAVSLELTDNGTSSVVQTLNFDLLGNDGAYQPSLISGIYIYADATLKITITKTGGTAKCGLCRVGWSTYIGATKYGISPGFVDYSIKDTDGFGYTYLSVGAWAKEIDLEAIIEYGNVDSVYEDLVAARGTLVGVECNEAETDYECLRAFGYIESWKIKIDNLKIIPCDINFKGVI